MIRDIEGTPQTWNGIHIFGSGIELMLAEALKYFLDMILMGCEVLGIYKDVIQIDDNTYV